MPWLADLVTILEGDSVGTFGTTIFTSTKAAPPLMPIGSAVLVIVETGGTSPERTHNDDIGQPGTDKGRPATVRPGAQITAKAADYDTAAVLAHLAYDSLVKVTNQFVNSGWYKDINVLQEPFDGGLDARGNAQCKFNIVGKVGQRPW